MQVDLPSRRGDLPVPEPAALAHAEAVRAHLLDRLHEAGGWISFGEFMRLALYAPGLGYYSAGTRKFGPGGDFVTAPEVSAVFSRILARQCAEVLSGLGGGRILELGAGSGAMAAEQLAFLHDESVLPEHYDILEVSADLRERQRHRIATRIPAALDRVRWLDALPSEPMRGVILGNEVLDALPVERFCRGASHIEQAMVAESGGKLTLQWRPAAESLIAYVLELEERLGRQLETGYVSEASLGLEDWIFRIASSLGEGVLLFSDYGLSESEYYAAERSSGTFRCHYRHRAHEDALFHPGLQDLTAWVNFSAVARAGSDAGLAVVGYTTQAHFLLAGGLREELAALADLPDRDRLALSAAVKTLTLPGEMGEIFRFIGFQRGSHHRPPAFGLTDLRPTL